MQIRTAAISVAFAGVLSLAAATAMAQTVPTPMRVAQAQQPADPLLAPPVRRPPKRVRIYVPEHWQPDVIPRYFPGSNAVRVCNATYVPEYRPSGTVIVPHMTCVWRPG